MQPGVAAQGHRHAHLSCATVAEPCEAGEGAQGTGRHADRHRRQRPCRALAQVCELQARRCGLFCCAVIVYRRCGVCGPAAGRCWIRLLPPVQVIADPDDAARQLLILCQVVPYSAQRAADSKE